MNCLVRGFEQVSKKPARTRLDDHALVHEHVQVADLAREVELVRHHDHRHPRLGKLAHYAQHLADELRVERRGRLVEEHHRGVKAERAGDRDALLLPARELRRIPRRPAKQADLPQPVRRALVGLGPTELLHCAERQCDVVERRQMREQIELLEDHADLTTEFERASTLHTRFAGNSRPVLDPEDTH